MLKLIRAAASATSGTAALRSVSRPGSTRRRAISTGAHAGAADPLPILDCRVSALRRTVLSRPRILRLRSTRIHSLQGPGPRLCQRFTTSGMVTRQEQYASVDMSTSSEETRRRQDMRFDRTPALRMAQQPFAILFPGQPHRFGSIAENQTVQLRIVKIPRIFQNIVVSKTMMGCSARFESRFDLCCRALVLQTALAMPKTWLVASTYHVEGRCKPQQPAALPG